MRELGQAAHLRSAALLRGAGRQHSNAGAVVREPLLGLSVPPLACASPQSAQRSN